MTTRGPAFRERLSLVVQREVGRLLAPLWIPLTVAVMRVGFGWRLEGSEASRELFRRIRRAGSGPLLVCANHLTMVDSFLIAWALAPPGWLVLHYGSLPWNTPERTNFAATWYMRCAVWLMKCVPVLRGGDRREVGRVLGRLGWLLSIGEVVLLFPEGGRSRSGRVDAEAVTYGVGRLVKNNPGCRVLCIHLRGGRQEGHSTLPARGDRFRVRVRELEPKTAHAGLRGSIDISRQVLAALRDLEEGDGVDRQ